LSEKANLKTIKELLDFTFVIETYQRGYRWDTPEVYSLLSDINEFSDSEESFYCLQPLVLQKQDDKTYELIDGQQRTTTIHLILMYLKSKTFSITYTTRNTSDDGENTFITTLQNIEVPKLDLDSILDLENNTDGFSALDNTISNFWKNNIVAAKPAINTVDNFYLYRAYSIITNWFNAKSVEENEQFEYKLLSQTKVIWYEEREIASKEKIIKKFIDFNEGKIELEQAELIKALFVLDILKNPNTIQRQYEEHQFAENWNLIEHQLSDKRFWQFVSNNKNDEAIANKINLVFQLHNGFGKNEDTYYNYRKFENQFKNADKDNSQVEKPQWDDLINLYNSLEEWFYDRTTYHLCGAIIHLTSFSTSKILEAAKKAKTKIEFRNSLREILKIFFFEKEVWKDKYNPEVITYSENKEVFKVLFLFNIALTHTAEKDAFFPFHRFYNVNSWNIEHILAKNDDGLDAFNEFKNYLKEVLDLIKTAVIGEDLSKENEAILSSLCKELEANIEDSKKSACKKKIAEINEKLVEIFDINDFNNLCLLDQSTNIKVGRRPFRDKRNITLGLDENIKLDSNAYIPIGTQYVFSKKATLSESYQTDYWSFIDRDFYLSKVKSTISQFLKLERDGD